MTEIVQVPEVPVVFLPAGIDACALYRMFLPHLNIRQSQFMFRPGALDLAEFQGAQVAIVQRQVSENNYKALQAMKQAGIKLVYDLDDNLWCLPAANPGQKIFKEMEDGFGVCAAECNILTVSTKGLQSAVRTALPHLRQEIVVVPNAMDFRLFRPGVTDRDDGKVIIGWAGSSTHNEDIREAWSVLPGILREYEHVKLELVGGAAPPPSLENHPRLTVRGWVPVGEFPIRFSSWAWDISMAPLTDNRFNRSKSNLKMLEAAAIQIPCLASDVQPYHEFASLGGPDLKWLLCSTEAQWNTKLRILINEPERRKELGLKMYQVAQQYYDIQVIKEHWKRVFWICAQ